MITALRCSHENVIITETVREHIDHVFEGGVYKFSDHYLGIEFVTLWVVCKDCGLNHSYSKSHLPKWLAEKWNLILKGHATRMVQGKTFLNCGE